MAKRENKNTGELIRAHEIGEDVGALDDDTMVTFALPRIIENTCSTRNKALQQSVTTRLRMDISRCTPGMITDLIMASAKIAWQIGPRGNTELWKALMPHGVVEVDVSTLRDRVSRSNVEKSRASIVVLTDDERDDMLAEMIADRDRRRAADNV